MLEEFLNYLGDLAQLSLEFWKWLLKFANEAKVSEFG